MGFEMRRGAKICLEGGGSPTPAVGHPPVCAWYWQAAPVHCWGQRHLYWFSPSRHVPPFWQGLLEHSLISAKKAATFHFILFWEASHRNAARTGPLWYPTARHNHLFC